MAVISVALSSKAPLWNNNLTIGVAKLIAPTDIGKTNSITPFTDLTIESINSSLLFSADNLDNIGYITDVTDTINNPITNSFNLFA